MKHSLILFSLLVLSLPTISAEESVQHPGYAIVLSNGVKLKVAEYQINIELDTITYRSDYSGLTATFPLERVKNIVRFDSTLFDIPETAQVVYRNELSIQDYPDDGGIPVTFKVKATSISSSDSGYTNSSSTKGSSSRSQGTSSGSSSSGKTTSKTNPFGQSSSRTSKPATSTTSTNSSPSSSQSSSSNSSSSAQEFMNAMGLGK